MIDLGRSEGTYFISNHPSGVNPGSSDDMAHHRYTPLTLGVFGSELLWDVDVERIFGLCVPLAC